MSDAPKIEQRAPAGGVANYAHPSNLPQCMVHGHQAVEDEDGTPMEMPLTAPVEGVEGISRRFGALRICVMCGTAYGVL